MARTHVLTAGVAGALVADPLAHLLVDRSATPGETIAFSLVTAGYGLLCDIDHPQATMSRVLGPVTQALAGVVGGLAGGHRKGTHTVWFMAAVVVLLGVLAPLWTWTAPLTVFVSLFFVAMVLRLGPRPRTGPAELSYALVGAAGTAAVVWLVPDLWWLPWAVGTGVLAHVLTDSLTTEGTMPFWPLLRFKLRVPVLGATGSTRESVLAFVLMVLWPVMLLTSFGGASVLDLVS